MSGRQDFFPDKHFDYIGEIQKILKTDWIVLYLGDACSPKFEGDLDLKLPQEVSKMFLAYYHIWIWKTLCGPK